MNLLFASPADATPQGTWAINSKSLIVERNGVAVKSSNLRSVNALIGDGSTFNNDFANGIFTHTFLDVGDYHCYHFPVSGSGEEK